MSQARSPRPDRPEAGPFVHSRLDEEVERLKTEPTWHDGDRNSITLTRRSGLTLVLTVLRAGAVLGWPSTGEGGCAILSTRSRQTF
jgi:hypothetical protein